MMRVKEIKKAQKPQGACEVCGTVITAGMPYKYAKGRYTPKHVRCVACPYWLPSELDTSKMAPALKAQEDAYDALDALSIEEYRKLENPFSTFIADVAAALEQCAMDSSASLEDYQAGLDNMPEGLQQGSVGEGIQEKIDMLEEWIENLNTFDPSEDVPDLSDYEDLEGNALVVKDEDKEAFDEIITNWADAILEEARDLLGSLEA